MAAVAPIGAGPRRGFRWTRETIAYAFVLWRRRHGVVPTQRDWERAGEDHPCRLTVTRVYGAWDDALRAAGLAAEPVRRAPDCAVDAPAVVRTGPRPGFRWNRQTVAYALDLWHRRHLRVPTQQDWSRAGLDHPCRLTVVRQFGTWNAALRAAGLMPRCGGGSRAAPR